MIQAVSHLVIATEDVSGMTGFFSRIFQLKPYFENPEFSEFVLPSRFRIAFFRPVGPADKYFKASADRSGVSIGVTTKNIDELYQRALGFEALCQLSGPPKDHPWGEKSFLLIDPDGNRWEITQSPSEDGMLVNKT